MKYLELDEPCRTAIREEICLGCQALESPYFRGKEILRIGEQMRI